MNQFNGKFACLKCLNPTYYKNHTTIYPTLSILNALESDDKKSITKMINMRSINDYLMQVEIAEDSNETYKGIKGNTYLANWIEIPRNVYLDKMHMVDIGSFIAIFNNFFSQETAGSLFI